MYEYYTADSHKLRLCNLGFSQDTLHSSPILTGTSRGASLMRWKCIAPSRRARAVYSILAALYIYDPIINEAL